MATAPLVNKLGSVTMSPNLLNILGQSQSTFNLRELMDSGNSVIFVDLAVSPGTRTSMGIAMRVGQNPIIKVK